METSRVDSENCRQLLLCFPACCESEGPAERDTNNDGTQTLWPRGKNSPRTELSRDAVLELFGKRTNFNPSVTSRITQKYCTTHSRLGFFTLHQTSQTPREIRPFSCQF